MKLIINIVIVFMFTNFAFSQNFVGKVTDKGGIPLPSTTIYIKGSNQGLICNESGYYQTNLAPSKYVVEYRCLGYQKQERSIEIQIDRIQTIDIVLQEKPFDLKEIVVSNAEDPAYTIIRKAIEKAPYHIDVIKEYTADVYIKGNGELLKVASLVNQLSKKTEGVKLSELTNQVFVQESFSEIQFTAPDKYKQTIKAFSSSIPDNMNAKDVMGITNSSLYMPKIHSFISPLNPKAFSYYKFRYEGYTEENGQIINMIKVTPKVKDPELLEGYLYIADDTWHINYAQLTSNAFGVKETYTIDYQKLDNDAYLPITYTTTSEVNILGNKAVFNYYASLKYSDIKIDNIVLRKENTLNKKKQKKTFEIKQDATYTKVTDSLSTNKDSIYWDSIRSIPLGKREIISFVRKDSVQQHLDSIRKEHKDPKFRLTHIITGGSIGSDSSKIKIKYGGLLRTVPEYNFVDGFWLGQRFTISYKIPAMQKWKMSPYIYYVTARKRLVGGLDLSTSYNGYKLGKLEISVGSTTQDFNPDGLDRISNSFTSLIQGQNHISLYQKDFISVTNAIDIANGLRLTTGIDIARRSGLTNNTDYTWGSRSRIQPNLFAGERFDQTAYHVGIDYTPEAYYTLTSGQKKYVKLSFPIFFINYTQGFLGWQKNNSHYRKLKGGLRQNIKTGYFGNIDYWAEGGFFIGNTDRTHFTDYQHFNTADLLINLKSPFTSFVLLNGYEASTNKNWVQTGVNYTNKYILLKRLPFLQGKMFTETLHLKNLYTPDIKLYTEAGYSVNLTRVMNAGIFTSFEKAKFRSWGIRISFDLNMSKGISIQ